MPLINTLVKIKQMLSSTVKSAPTPSSITVGKLHYKKTNLKTIKNVPIYKKSGPGTYYAYSGEKFKLLPNSTAVKSNKKGIMPLALQKSPNVPITHSTTHPSSLTVGKSQYKKTNLFTLNNKPIYKKVGGTSFHGKTLKSNFGIIPKTTLVKKANGTKMTIQSIKVPLPPNIASPSLITTLVPIVKLGPDHILATTKVHIDKLSRIAAQFKNLEQPTTHNLNKLISNYRTQNGKMAFVSGSRTNKFTFNVSKMDKWDTCLDKPSFTKISYVHQFTYNQYTAAAELKLEMGQNVNSFENVQMSDVIDRKWYFEQDAYIRNLSSRQLLCILGYTHFGNKIIHEYLDGNFTLAKYKASAGYIYFFPFYFQAREFYKMEVGTPSADYSLVIERVKAEKTSQNAKCIMNMYINELNAVIRNSPPVTKSFVTFRGEPDPKFIGGTPGHQYTTERFTSSSVSASVARGFGGLNVLKRITILKGSRCLLLFGITQYAHEMEVLLARGATYQIMRIQKDVTSTNGTNLLNPKIKHKTKHLADIVMIGTVEPPLPKSPVKHT